MWPDGRPAAEVAKLSVLGPVVSLADVLWASFLRAPLRLRLQVPGLSMCQKFHRGAEPAPAETDRAPSSNVLTDSGKCDERLAPWSRPSPAESGHRAARGAGPGPASTGAAGSALPGPPAAPAGGERGSCRSESDIFSAMSPRKSTITFLVSTDLKIRAVPELLPENPKRSALWEQSWGLPARGPHVGSPRKRDRPQHSSLCPVRCWDCLMPRADLHRERKGTVAALGSSCRLPPPASGNDTGLGQGFPTLT